MNAHRLLVVDDQPAIANFIKAVAEEAGYEVAAATSPEAAIRLVRTLVPDVICLDLVMPGVDGVELLEALAGAGCKAAIVLVSGMDVKVIDSARQVGADNGLNMVGGLQKPLRIDEMEALFEKARRPAARPEVTENTMPGAVGNGRIEVNYLPRIQIEPDGSARVVGVEALPLISQPKPVADTGEAFIPRVEPRDLNGAAMYRFVEDAVIQLTRLEKEGFHLNLAFNFMAQLLNDRTFPDRLSHLCSRLKVAPERISLEITEGAAMQDTALTTEVLIRFRLKEFRISMAEFGSGYSSLVQIYRMPFTELKVDRSFVSAMAPNNDMDVIVRSMVEMGKSLGLAVCADGVDSKYALSTLAACGCNHVQGSMFAGPMSAGALTQLLREWSSPPQLSSKSA